MKALEIAREVADETGTLMAGNICNTTVYKRDDENAINKARNMFKVKVANCWYWKFIQNSRNLHAKSIHVLNHILTYTWPRLVLLFYKKDNKYLFFSINCFWSTDKHYNTHSWYMCQYTVFDLWCVCLTWPFLFLIPQFRMTIHV